MSTFEMKEFAHRNFNYQFWENYITAKKIHYTKTIIVLHALKSESLNEGIAD